MPERLREILTWCVAALALAATPSACGGNVALGSAPDGAATPSAGGRTGGGPPGIGGKRATKPPAGPADAGSVPVEPPPPAAGGQPSAASLCPVPEGGVFPGCGQLDTEPGAFSPCGPVEAIDYSRSQRYLVLATLIPSRLVVWNLATGRTQWNLDDAPCTVQAVAVSPSGRQLAVSRGIAAEHRSVITTYDLRAGTDYLGVVKSDEVRATVTSLAFSNPEGAFAAAAQDGALLLWTGAQAPPPFGSPSTHVEFSPADATRLLLGGVDGSFSVWQTSGIQMFWNAPDVVGGAATYSPDGQTIAASRANGELGLFDASSGSARESLVGHAAPVVNIGWLDVDHVVSADATGAVIEWAPDPVAGQFAMAKKWNVGPRNGRGFAVMPDRATLAVSASRSGQDGIEFIGL